jgi:hypothetical protein
MPIRKTEIPMETTSQERCYTKGRKEEHGNEVDNGTFEETKKMEKFAC